MDIFIRRIRDRAFITAQSLKGEDWIRENMLRKDFDVCVVIAEDLADELADDLRSYGLTVEVK